MKLSLFIFCINIEDDENFLGLVDIYCDPGKRDLTEHMREGKWIGLVEIILNYRSIQGMMIVYRENLGMLIQHLGDN